MTTQDAPKPGSDEAVAGRGWYRNPHQPNSWCYEGSFPVPPMPPEAERDMDPQAEIARLRHRLAATERERDVMRARISAAKRRLGDLKMIHSRWFDGDGRASELVANDLEHMAFSVGCYLDGVPGEYLSALAPPAPEMRHLTEAEQRTFAKALRRSVTILPDLPAPDGERGA